MNEPIIPVGYTYRKDLYYVQTENTYMNKFGIEHKLQRCCRERVVNKFTWWLYRIQFWRFEKYNNYNVLSERWMAMDWNKSWNRVWWHPIIEKLFRKKI